MLKIFYLSSGSRDSVIRALPQSESHLQLLHHLHKNSSTDWRVSYLRHVHTVLCGRINTYLSLGLQSHPCSVNGPYMWAVGI